MVIGTRSPRLRNGADFTAANLVVSGTFTYANVSATGVTGTGNIVFSNSPTFSGDAVGANLRLTGTFNVGGVAVSAVTGTGNQATLPVDATVSPYSLTSEQLAQIANVTWSATGGEEDEEEVPEDLAHLSPAQQRVGWRDAWSRWKTPKQKKWRRDRDGEKHG